LFICLLVIIACISAFIIPKTETYVKPSDTLPADELVVLFTNTAKMLVKEFGYKFRFENIYANIFNVVYKNSLKNKNTDIDKFVKHLINYGRYNEKKLNSFKYCYYYIDSIICNFIAIYYTTISINIEIKYYLETRETNKNQTIMVNGINNSVLNLINAYESLTNKIIKFKMGFRENSNVAYVKALNEAQIVMSKDIEKYNSIYTANNFTENSFEINSDVINKMEILMDCYKENDFSD
jgi:hypothetical protein